MPHSPDIVFSRCITFSEDLSKTEQIQPCYDYVGIFEGDLLREVLEKKYQLTLTSPVNKFFKRDFLVDNSLFLKKGLAHEEDEWLPRVIVNAKVAWFDNTLLYGARCGRIGSLSSMDDDVAREKKACSKMYIANSGMQYMLRRNLDNETLCMVAEHYWKYLIDACVGAYQITDITLQKKAISYIKKNRNFFKCYKKLANKKWRLMGLMFLYLGVGFTTKIVTKRYMK